MISIIVASSENNVIGNDNKLVWKLPNDLKRFKEITSDNTVIMGRKTYESIGKPLPNRLNIVISRSKIGIPGAIVVGSVEEAIKKSPINREIFIIDGSQIYNSSIKYVNNIYLTKVHSEFDGDSFFYSEEDLESMGFKEVDRVENPSDDQNEFPHTYISYRK